MSSSTVACMKMIVKPLFAAVTALLVISCNGGGDNDSAIAGGGGRGTLTLDFGDAPVDDLVEVNLTVTAVEFGGDDGSTSEDAVDVVELSTPREINLLDWQNGDFYNLLNGEEVKSGDYEWVRLRLDYEDNPPEVLVRGEAIPRPLDIPSGEQTGLKLHGGGVLSIDSDGEHHYAIDLDLHRSLILTGSGTYKLKPSYRLIDIDNSYSISGQVLGSVPVGCNGAIYVFRGDVIPDDIENPDDGETVPGVNSDDTVEPEAVVVLDGTISSGASYTVNNLAAGTYTLAFTCDAEDDNLDEDNDDSVDFIGAAIVEDLDRDLTNVDIE